MVSLDRKNWRPLVLSGSRRGSAAVNAAVRKAAREGGLAELESLLDLIENRQRRVQRESQR